MNLSSRWCVTAVVALGAVACSDPVPPASQGAIIVTVQSNSPAPSGKSCPIGASTTFDVPTVDPKLIPSEVLDDDTYLHWIVDGASSSTVSCTVKGGSAGYQFSGRIAGQTLNGRGTMEITNGTLDGSGKGTATISLASTATAGAFSPMSSPAGACTVDASKGTGNHQVQPGSMWATFTCSSIEAQPADYCKARGIFVLENCSQ